MQDEPRHVNDRRASLDVEALPVGLEILQQGLVQRHLLSGAGIQDVDAAVTGPLLPGLLRPSIQFANRRPRDQGVYSRALPGCQNRLGPSPAVTHQPDPPGLLRHQVSDRHLLQHPEKLVQLARIGVPTEQLQLRELLWIGRADSVP